MASGLEITAKAKNDIMKGSKSFSMASLFFNADTKEASWYLYSWCRYCDDQVDNSNQNQISETVEHLRQQTLNALAGRASEEHPWPALQKVSARYKIPSRYALDLIEGFKRDALKKPIQNEEDLLQYCYGVAGTVGLMMCHIMGVSSSRALLHAVALGRAMQMTNIARDIREDHLNSRLYLPLTWLNEVGLTEANYLNPENSEKLNLIVRKLLQTAEQQYLVGQDGLQYLPTRAAWAVACALRIYRAIGRKIEKDIPQSLRRRCVISKPEKIIHLFFASFDISRLWLKRLVKPFQPTQNIELWRNS